MPLHAKTKAKAKTEHSNAARLKEGAHGEMLGCRADGAILERDHGDNSERKMQISQSQPAAAPFFRHYQLTYRAP
jgi:hypothetical protein